MQANSGYGALAQTIAPPRGLPRYAVLAALVVAGSAFVAIAAQVRINLPFTPVPITGQTFAVLTVGGLLGSRLGAASLLLYMMEGSVGLLWASKEDGLTVFAPGAAGGNGWEVIVGPTGGYIIGFVAAAFVVGWLAERGFDKNPLSAVVAMAAGNVLVYVFGLPWLDHFFPGQSLEFGLYPFILGDAAKLLLAASLLPAGWAILRYVPGYESAVPALSGEFRTRDYRLPLPWLYLAAGVFVVLGAVLPWGLVNGGSDLGLELRAGVVVLAAGLAAVALSLVALPKVLPWELVRIGEFAAGAVAGYASYYHIVQILTATDDFQFGDLGAGLALSALASVLLVAVSILDQPQGPAEQFVDPTTGRR